MLIVDAKSDLNVYRHDDGTNAGCCAAPEPAQEKTNGCSSSEQANGCCGPAKSKPAQAATVSNFDNVDFNEFAGKSPMSPVLFYRVLIFIQVPSKSLPSSRELVVSDYERNVYVE